MKTEKTNKTIYLEYKCPCCWEMKRLEYKDYWTAKRNKVYCDTCITKRMHLLTNRFLAEELIATLED